VIYCVIPEALAEELYEKMKVYYAGDPNVEVIVDRRKTSRRRAGSDPSAGSEQRQVRDRRRRRLVGELPEMPAGD
jgi:hypothetical protein